jgi:hypothetical protein
MDRDIEDVCQGEQERVKILCSGKVKWPVLIPLMLEIYPFTVESRFGLLRTVERGTKKGTLLLKETPIATYIRLSFFWT